MKKLLLFFVTFLTITSVTYASFPVVDPVIDPPIIEVLGPASGDFNWQAIVSVVCGSIAWNISWVMCIPGLVFGFLAIKGDKNMKWLGWIGLIENALMLGIMLAYLSL
jgi:hypothetical protein